MVSPHFGPWTFGPDENPFDTRDFEAGEEVHVTLDGPKDAYVVRSVVAARQRQPRGTECEAFAPLSGVGDMWIQAWDESELRFWLGDCCEQCSDPWWTITFEHPHTVGLDEDTDLGCPLLRFASDAEIAEHRLAIPSGARAYCIVTAHGSGRDGPRVFVVADGVRLERGSRDRRAW